jgi:hypothetical protein
MCSNAVLAEIVMRHSDINQMFPGVLVVNTWHVVFNF